MYFALGGTSLAWDVLIIIMPFPILRRLQLDTRSKVSQTHIFVSIVDDYTDQTCQVALTLLFALGFFVTIIQCIRIQTISALSTYTDSQPIIEWSIVEINLGVITACIPTFRPFLRNLSHKIASSNGTKFASFGRRSKGVSTHKSNKINLWSENRAAKFPPKGDASREPQEEDEIELWDGYNKHPGQQKRTSAHVQAELGGSLDSLSADVGKDETQITVRHDISVQYGSSDGGSR